VPDEYDELYWVCPACGVDFDGEGTKLKHLQETYYDLDHVREGDGLLGSEKEFLEEQNLYL
jgi:hypothetical protein